MSKTILIVEDDNFLQGLASRKLQNEGYTILAAQDSVSAFKILETALPDLILLDLLLPGEVDGYGILKNVRETEKTKAIPVIVFSNLSDEKDIMKAKALGINEFMIKANFTLDELTKKVKGLLG